MRRQRPILILLAAVVAVGSGILYGVLAVEHDLFPAALLTEYEGKLRRLPSILKGRPPVDSVASTSLLRLNVRRISVPSNPAITNGSLTRVGGDMLLMSGAGEIFLHSRGADAVVRSGVQAPPNHLPELQEVARTSKYAGYVQDMYTNLRYLHLLHVEVDMRHLLFISYTEWHPDQECYTNTVARRDITERGADASLWQVSPEDWRVIFRTSPCLPMKRKMRAIEAHLSGGRMLFDEANRRLILTVGDFHWDGVFNDVALSQDDSNDYGKIVSFDLDGGSPEHVAKGLRNAQGITYDNSGRIWLTEHGPNGGDELNLLQAGSNYGWPLATLGKGYNGLPWKPARQFGRHDDFTAPIYSWIPSVGLSSIIQVQGFDPAWEGDFLVGSMNGNTVYRLRIVDGTVQFVEPIPFGERIRYILQPEPGVIALWTDSRHLIIVTRAADDEAGLHLDRYIEAQPWSVERKDAVRTAISACTQCHSYRPEPGRGAPYLMGVHDRPVASTGFAQYSDGMRAFGGRWTEDRLVRSLADTESFVPGSSMPRQGLALQTAHDVAQVLQALDAAD